MPAATGQNVVESDLAFIGGLLRRLGLLRWGGLIGFLALAGCGDERSVEVALQVPVALNAEVCLTAADRGELLFAQSYPALEANGTLTFVAGDRIDQELRAGAVLRRGGRAVAWAAGSAPFRAPGRSRLPLALARCRETPVPASTTLGNAAGATRLLAGDLDGDGIDEVLASGAAIEIVGGGPIEGSGGATAVSLGDVDGDCLPDIIATGPAGIVALPSGLPLSAAGTLALLGDAGRGKGLASADEDGLRWGPLDGLMRSLTGAPVRDLAIGDLDGDGTDDLIAVGEGGIQAFFGGPAGPTLAAGATPTGWTGRHAALGDLDGDGSLDLVVATDTEIRVARNRGDGLLEARASVAFPGARGLRIVDADHDCRDDVVALGVDALLFRGADDAMLTARLFPRRDRRRGRCRRRWRRGPGARRARLERSGDDMGSLRALTLAAVVATSSVAAAQSARAEVERHLDDGRRLYRELDFAGCVDAMNRALAVPGIDPAGRLEAWEYLGAAYVVLDRREDAEAAFREVFALDPYHVVREPSGSPKIERFVEELRARLVPDAALDSSVALDARLPRAGRVGRPTPVQVDVNGPPDRTEQVTQVALHLRGDDETEWSAVELEAVGATYEGEIPARSTTGELELYAEGRDAAGRVVARAGEPLVPLTMIVREGDEEATPPLRRRWWLWTIVGVVVVGLAAGIGAAAAGSDTAPAGTLAPGRVELP